MTVFSRSGQHLGLHPVANKTSISPQKSYFVTPCERNGIKKILRGSTLAAFKIRQGLPVVFLRYNFCFFQIFLLEKVTQYMN